MSPALRQAVVPAYLFLCLLLGGSTQGIWFNLALQLGGILLLVWAMLAEQRSQTHDPAPTYLGDAAAYVEEVVVRAREATR